MPPFWHKRLQFSDPSVELKAAQSVPSQEEGRRQGPQATPESSVTPPVEVLSPGPSLMQATRPPPTRSGLPPVKFNLVSNSLTFSILVRGAGVGAATTLGPDRGGGHSASIEPGAASTERQMAEYCGAIPTRTVCQAPSAKFTPTSPSLTSSPCWISNRSPPVAVRPRLAESLFAPICRSNSPLLWHERKEKPDVLPGSGRMEDLSVRKEAPVRRKSSDCSPKQLPRRSASPKAAGVKPLIAPRQTFDSRV